jgi:hypothetical protein
LPPVHVPLWQVSVCVHALPSLHPVPFALAGFEHVPSLGLHVPASWHWSLAVQLTGLPGAQVPFWHVSFVVHLLPSSHALPFALGLQPVLLVAGAHSWQALAGLTAPEA